MNTRMTLFACLALVATPSLLPAGQPDWVAKRPILADSYVGVGMAEKTGPKSEWQRKAELAALLDLASMISVNISGEFINVVTEATGMSEDYVRSEIKASAAARLTGHELADTWEGRKEYWVYYRLHKGTYEKQRRTELAQAIKNAGQWAAEADRELKAGNMGGSFLFRLRAFSALQDFVAETLPPDSEKSAALFAESLAALRRSLDALTLQADRQKLYALAGRPPPDAISVTICLNGEPSKPQANIPVRFTVGDKTEIVPTDAKGLARLPLPPLDTRQDGVAAKAALELASFLGTNSVSPFLSSLITRLVTPEIRISLRVFDAAEQDKYLLSREFEGRKVLVACAYEADGKVTEWKKMHDEVMTFVKGQGAVIKNTKQDLKAVVGWAGDPEGEWAVAGAEPGDLVIVITAVGKLNRRKSDKSPTGEDVQFAGEILAAAHVEGKPHFADRFSGTGGWNPMGESMCMDVLALNVMKRWQPNYLKNLGADGK